MWFNPDRWPTSDGIIPHRLFILFMGLTTNLMTMEQMGEAQAIAQGISIAFTSKEHQGKLKQQLKKLEKIAFPAKE